MRTHGGHEFDTAARSGKRQGPNGILAGQTYHIGQLGGKEAFARVAFGAFFDQLYVGLAVNIILDWTCHKI
jgi:hypothetical protein